jgi:anti-sigma regulatory factor (Ser/Thr protein kinase)
VLRLSVPARLAYMSLLRGAIGGLEAYYADSPLAPSSQTVYAWGLAIYEAATNVVRHGYAGGSEAPLTLTVAPESDRVVFTLADHGAPNPAWPWSPGATASFEDGGYGQRIIHQVMDEVTYQPGAGGLNILTMTAFLSEGAG